MDDLGPLIKARDDDDDTSDAHMNKKTLKDL